MPNSGYFVIADISGYTRLLTQSELEHAEGIVRSLITTLLEHTRPPLVISRLQGDAIFSYAPDGSFLEGQTLLEAIENTYCAYRRALEREEHSTTCDCKACTLIPTLDLKFVVHHGQYVLETLGNTRELQGSDVIVAHRLLKNGIVERTGVQAYAFFTEAAASAMMLGDLVRRMVHHTETYEHLGEVGGYIHDLHPVWAQEREKQRVWVAPTDALWFTYSTEVPVPPALAWDYLHKPEKKRQWLKLDSIDVLGLNGDRKGAGMIHHCVHGERSWRQVFVDWRPFDYATAEYQLPLHGVGRLTLALTSTAGGTRVTVRSARPQAPTRLRTLLVRAIMAGLKKGIAGNWQAGLRILKEIIEADLTAGKIAAHVDAQPVHVETATKPAR